MTTQSEQTTITIDNNTYNLLQEVKKVFASYTGEDISEFSDDKVIEVLASGFFDTEEDESCGCGNGSCACNNDDKEEWCGCGGHHHH